MSYREPIAPNPEPAPPKPREPFDFDKYRGAVARGIIATALIAPPILLTVGVVTGREGLMIPGGIGTALDICGLLMWAANEVWG